MTYLLLVKTNKKINLKNSKNSKNRFLNKSEKFKKIPKSLENLKNYLNNEQFDPRSMLLSVIEFCLGRTKIKSKYYLYRYLTGFALINYKYAVYGFLTLVL